MRASIALIFLLFFAQNSNAAIKITRVNAETIRIEGEIEEGDLEKKLQKALRSNPQVLELDSPGGDAEVGLKMGELIRRKNINTSVTGYCLSSCANYLFLAGRKKQISGGLVGFHGNIRALLSNSWEETLNDMRNAGLSDSQIADVRAQIVIQASQEDEFFRSLGIPQDLFNRTQSNDYEFHFFYG